MFSAISKVFKRNRSGYTIFTAPGRLQKLHVYQSSINSVAPALPELLLYSGSPRLYLNLSRLALSARRVDSTQFAMPDRVFSANPDSGFTYNATILSKDGTNSEVAKTQHRRIKEKGTITLLHPLKTYKVTHSTHSGRWDLVLDDPFAEEDPIIIATKPKWHRDSITLEMGDEVYEFVRPSIMRRDYIVGRIPKDGAADRVNINKGKPYELSGTQIGELRTDSFLKRSYAMRFDDDVPVELPLFCYWLASLLNKRADGAAASASI